MVSIVRNNREFLAAGREGNFDGPVALSVGSTLFNLGVYHRPCGYFPQFQTIYTCDCEQPAIGRECNTGGIIYSEDITEYMAAKRSIPSCDAHYLSLLAFSPSLSFLWWPCSGYPGVMFLPEERKRRPELPSCSETTPARAPSPATPLSIYAIISRHKSTRW
ncbi:hypothetical protein ASPWEDRAFT_656925 [Aspergillus wentii DTO 134E9]|uniref:Uncharacterized protein n=1 Tax=Aspergillus wentii DTO 134E9 TaxID=1073089 RepID=A0A1L9RBJ7_ASPWE|nr:uncharacterized protein ASPWEDRAFT_656925 [Aspergillus wentii DTO 134E9]OJJ32294.1 hypothetical protein ASPWEDRAFT_656925 [Aspergillus wentii DTO 134E9]